MKNFVQIIINDVYRPFTHSSEWNLNVICCLKKRVIQVFVSFVLFFFYCVSGRQNSAKNTHMKNWEKEMDFFAFIILCIRFSFFKIREEKHYPKIISLCCLGAKSLRSTQRAPKCWATRSFVDRQTTASHSSYIFFRLNKLVRFWMRKVGKCKLILWYATHTRRTRAREC